MPITNSNLELQIVFFFYETSKPGLTYDSQLYHPNALASTVAQYKAHKTGPLSVFPFGTFAWARLDTQLSDSPLWTNAPRAGGRDPMGLAPCQPHIEMWNSECYGGPLDFVDFPVNGEHVFAMVALLWNAKSRGTVTIDSSDPMGVPVVDPNFLSDEEGLDMLVLSEGCRYANAIAMNGKGTKDIVNGSWPRGRDHHTWTSSREQWTEYVRENAMQCYHPAGTCKMGKADDAMAVCDERLRVRGVKGLRVVDVSVMPIVNNGHTQMPAYAIGEKAADTIKEDWKRA
jgi:choline dehydrogenase-like flavoprotein